MRHPQTIQRKRNCKFVQIAHFLRQKTNSPNSYHFIFVADDNTKVNMKKISVIAFAAMLILAASCEDTIEKDVERGDDSPSLTPVEGDDSSIDASVFEVLNLDAPGLSKVKSAYEAGHLYEAAVELRNYWRSRSGVFNPNVDLIAPALTSSQRRIAEQALEHRFYINQNYYESVVDNVYTYFLFEKDGKIDWTYVPEKYSGDQEFYYQIHRHNWVPNVGKAYWVTRSEDYAKSFCDTYLSWSDTYPVPVGVVFPAGESNNINYQWKGLQPATRVLNYLDALPYVIQSDNVTPEFFCRFIKEFAQSVECIRANYYTETNILISQSKAVAIAGILMPELASSDEWKNEGVGKLSNELDEQFFPDGVHYEFDPSYHIAAISDFQTVYEFAKANGCLSLLPESYISKLEKAAEFVVDITFPDYSIDNFNDTRSSSYSRSVLMRNFRKYSQMFPDNGKFLWMATAGTNGTAPDYTSKSYPAGGYYILRNGWDSKSNVFILKSNDNVTEKWHCQPDNGTFALWSNGRNFFPDAGCFAYNGSNRTKYRATAQHNTITVSGRTYASAYCGSELVSFSLEPLPNGLNCVTAEIAHSLQNGVRHNRRVYMVADKVYVVVDKVVGNLAGETVEFNCHILADGNDGNIYRQKSLREVTVSSDFYDGNNVVMDVISNTDGQVEHNIVSPYSSSLNVETGEREGFRLKVEGSAASDSSPIYFASVIVPGVKSGTASLQYSSDCSEITVSATCTTSDSKTLDYSFTLPNIN